MNGASSSSSALTHLFSPPSYHSSPGIVLPSRKAKMMGLLKNSLLLSVLGSAAYGRCGNTNSSRPQIQWGPCTDIAASGERGPPFECGNFTVPLDYTNLHANETLQLRLLRVPAAVQPARGSIQLNFGGPGLESRGSLAELGGLLQA